MRLRDGTSRTASSSAASRSRVSDQARSRRRRRYYDFEIEMDWMLGEVPNVKCSEELGPKEENLSDSGVPGQ